MLSLGPFWTGNGMQCGNAQHTYIVLVFFYFTSYIKLELCFFISFSFLKSLQSSLFLTHLISYIQACKLTNKLENIFHFYLYLQGFLNRKSSLCSTSRLSYIKFRVQLAKWSCSCPRNTPCHLNGKWLLENVVYKATVTQYNGQQKLHTGMCLTAFKARLGIHKDSFINEEDNQTALSKFMWSLKRKNITYGEGWERIDQARPFSPVTGQCALCIRGKLSQPKFNQQLSSTEFEVRLNSYPVIHHPPTTTQSQLVYSKLDRAYNFPAKYLY